MQDPRPSFTPGRKWRIGFSVAVALGSALAIVIMANYLAARHSARVDWSGAAANKLSPLTIRALNSLTNDVKIIVFFDRNEPLFGHVASLIKDYQIRSPRLEVEFIDYRFPGRAELIRSQYQLTSPSESSRVIFDCNGRVKSVLAGELSEYALGPDREFRRSAFKGEQLFTSALISVTAPRRTKAYFLSGHGEHNPESQDDQTGYQRFAKMLLDNDVDADIFASLHFREVPDDCGLLIIAGADQRFAREELERLDRYLTQGGRMFVLFNMFNTERPLTGLEALLYNWNVQVGLNQIQDRSQSQATEDLVIVANHFSPHPITKPLLRSSIRLVLPRSVSARAGGLRADAPKPSELVFTSKGAVAGRINDKGMPEIELTGSIPLAVAVEKGGIQGLTADRGATRLVVMGSSVSLANAAFPADSNADFANLAVNWLLNRDLLLTDIPPRAISEYRITVTERQMGALRWIFLAAAPGGALLLGGLVWVRRRV